MNCLGIMLFDPLLPWWAMAICLVLFALVAWHTYAQCNLSFHKRAVLFTLRLLAFLIICWLLLQPFERTREVIGEKTPVLLVLDNSASMEDRPLGVRESRAEAARKILNSRALKRIQKYHQVMSFNLGEGMRRGLGEQTGQFSAGQSRLISGLQDVRKATRGDRPVAMILLTDGLDTSGLSTDGLVLDVPVIVPELENQRQIKEDHRLDYSVALPDNQGVKRVIKGWKTSVRVTINRLRGKGKDVIPVVLMKDKQELEVRMVDFQPDSRYAQTTFEVKPESLGNQAYQIAIRPPRDLEAQNNQAEFVLEVTDDENRVLYLEGLLRPDFKFFKRALQKEKSFQASVYLRLGNGLFMNFDNRIDSQHQMNTLLTDENLKNCKVLILGEFAGDSFEEKQIKAVKKFVEQGGGLLLTGSSRSYGVGGYLTDELLGPLSPVTSEDGARMAESEAFPLNFSPAGRNDSVFMKLAAEASFPPLRSVWQPVKLSQGALKILETEEGAPVLAVRRYGEGRVCIYLSNTLYLLRLHGGGAEGVSDYDRLVSQTIFWMLPDIKKKGNGDALQLLLKDDTADVNHKIAVGALSGADEEASNLHCEVTWPDGKLTTLPMQSSVLEKQVGLSAAKKGFLSEFKATQVGTYGVEVVRSDGQRTGQKMLIVQRPVLEMTGEPMNRVLLKQLVDGSKGKFIPYGETDGLLDGISIPDRSKELVHEETLWDSWFWLVPLMALFCLEWTLRRHWDLV